MIHLCQFELPRQMSAAPSPPGFQGESLWKSWHLSQFSPAVLCLQTHCLWTWNQKISLPAELNCSFRCIQCDVEGKMMHTHIWLKMCRGYIRTPSVSPCWVRVINSLKTTDLWIAEIRGHTYKIAWWLFLIPQPQPPKYIWSFLSIFAFIFNFFLLTLKFLIHLSKLFVKNKKPSMLTLIKSQYNTNLFI